MLKWMYLGVAAAAGAAMAFQGTFNTAMTKVLGIWQSTFIVHLLGLVTTLIFLLALKIGPGQFAKITEVPWYAFLGGVLNVLIIFTVVKAISQIGVGNATTAIIVVQIVTALIIDHLGAFGMKKYPFHYWDLLGVILLAVGARILFIK